MEALEQNAGFLRIPIAILGLLVGLGVAMMLIGALWAPFILGPFVFVGLGAAIVLVGALWSPAAAALCARAARRRGLAPGRYAIWGALYSILMIVPWVLLLQRLHGSLIPRRLLELSYWILYVGIWGCGMIAFFFNFAVILLLAVASSTAYTTA